MGNKQSESQHPKAAKTTQDFKPPINHSTMASTSNALILGNDAVEIYDPSTHVIEDYGSYKKAKVDNSASPKSFYVVYDKEHYGTSQGSATQAHLVPPDPLGSDLSQTVTTSFDIASTQGFDIRDPAIILFEHPNYIGNARQYRSSQRDVSRSFPRGDHWSGVSSFIVTGGKWNLYGAKNMKPPLLKTVTTGFYTWAGSANDKVMSIERVDM